MSSEGSVTRWVTALKAGDTAAAQPLWERYHRQMITLARRKLASSPAGGPTRRTWSKAPSTASSRGCPEAASPSSTTATTSGGC
jgi:hypothetical protein